MGQRGSLKEKFKIHRTKNENTASRNKWDTASSVERKTYRTKNYTWLSGICSRYTKLVQSSKIDHYNLLYQQPKEQKSWLSVDTENAPLHNIQ